MIIRLIKSTAKINLLIKSELTILNTGVNPSPCPLITCVDGGNAFTAVFPAINGIILGGNA